MKTTDITSNISFSDIKDIQTELLKETVRHAYENSGYYRHRFISSGILPAHINNTEDIQKMPFTTREDLQQNNWDFLAVPKESVAEIVSTTGTTGEPAFIALTYNDLERLAYNEKRSFTYAGATKNDLFHIAVTCDNLFIAGIAYYSGLIKLGASVTRTGPQNIIRHLDLIKKLKPTGIVAVPSFIVRIARTANEIGEDINGLGIKKAVLIGDSIRNSDFGLNALGMMINDSIGDIFYSTYGITEAQVSFCECRMKQGLHSHPEFIFAEIIDDNGNALQDGETGELVLTTLQIEGMPLIRYRTGDITFKISGPCLCGLNSMRIGPILGRKNQRLKVKGVTLYPKTIENALLGIKEIVNYQIEAGTGNDQTDEITVRVGSHRNDPAFRSSLINALQAKARVTPKIEIEPPQEIDRKLFEGGSRKAITFKDRRLKAYDQ